MVAFSGSDDVNECMRWDSGQRKPRYVDAMRAPYPGIGREIRQDKFMNWPDEEWTKASFYFPRLKAGYGGWRILRGNTPVMRLWVTWREL